MAQIANATGTRAGTVIDNVATATFSNGSGPETTLQSNIISIRVDELLDVAIASRDTADVVVAPGSSGRLLAFTLTNAGNGPEAFVMTGIGTQGGDDFDPDITALAIDTDGNGQYDAAIDTGLANGASTPTLQPDASVTIFLLSSIASSVADGHRGQVILRAVAATGAGDPGTAFAGQGESGGDALVGASRGEQQGNGFYRVSRANLTFLKSAAVRDSFGGTRAVPGSIITYTLDATTTGSGALPGLEITDTIPAGTNYEPGSLTLDNQALSDATDSDAGRASADAIAVTLGSVAAGSAHRVTFKVKIK